MINVLLEITRKIEEFKLQTGFNPNVIYLSYSTHMRIESILKNRSKLIESYPDIFKLPMRVVKKEIRFSVGLVI